MSNSFRNVLHSLLPVCFFLLSDDLRADNSYLTSFGMNVLVLGITSLVPPQEIYSQMRRAVMLGDTH
jgi:hypothetical protein